MIYGIIILYYLIEWLLQVTEGVEDILPIEGLDSDFNVPVRSIRKPSRLAESVNEFVLEFFKP